jgi:hypothetical protein
MRRSFLCATVCTVASMGMLSLPAFAEDGADRAKLSGAWQQQGAGAAQAVWTIEETSAGMRVISSQGEKKVAEFVCDFARECEAKDAGKKVKITLYFNGGKLVVMETKGDQVVKRRFGFGEAADVMELEMIPVAPAGKPETVLFTRVATAAAKP